MALMTIREFLELAFTEESRPQYKTIIDWIERGELKGRRFGRKYYVDDSELENLRSNSMDDEKRLIENMIKKR